MAKPKDYEEESLGLNMTPMIDIVFQLIVFFMLNLKFKATDSRIDTALPKDRGIQATPTIVNEIPSIKVSLFRRNEDKEDAQTMIKIGSEEWFVPRDTWSKDAQKNAELQLRRDRVFASLLARIAALYAANKELKGEIEAPPPKGQAVPHADIMGVLDSFLAVGLKEVNFVGAASPLPKAKGGHGP